MDYLFEELKTNYNLWHQTIEEMERLTNNLPKGHLSLRKRKGRTTVYQHILTEQNGEKRVIRKSLQGKPLNEIEDLLYRYRLQRTLPHLKKNMLRIERLLQTWKPKPEIKRGDDQELFLWLENERKKKSECFQSEKGAFSSSWKAKGKYQGKEILVEKWLREKASVFQNGKWIRDVFISGEEAAWHLEGLRHVTLDGSLRRSKSEVILDGLLREMGVAYVYERPLYIGNRRFLPDYTVLQPESLQPFFVEHHGLRSEEYERRNWEKEQVYRQGGIVPWSNLLYTYDLPDGTLDVRGVRKALQLFLN